VKAKQMNIALCEQNPIHELTVECDKLKEINTELVEALKGFIHSVENEGAIYGRIVCAMRNAKVVIAKVN